MNKTRITPELAEPCIDELTNALMSARAAIGRAATGLPFEVVFGAIGLLLCDVIEQVKEAAGETLENAENARHWLEQARHLGQTIVWATEDEKDEASAPPPAAEVAP